MKSETRSNLIFLLIFLAISLPGAVILVKKKMAPGARDMSMPEAVRKQVSFVDPQEVASNVKRVFPPITASWINNEIGPQIELPSEKLVRYVRSEAGVPTALISQRRTAQVLAARSAEGSTSVALLLWNAPDAPAGHMSIRTNWKGEESAAQLTTRAIDVPPRIKRELRDLGTIHPPEQVHLVIATWPGVDSLPRELQITYDNHSPSADLVTLFTD